MSESAVDSSTPLTSPERWELGRWWRRVPLRVRLVAAVLALVVFALVVIGATSVFELHRYLIARVDGQLTGNAAQIAADPQLRLCQRVVSENVVVEMPSDYLVGLDDRSCHRVLYDSMAYNGGALPALSTDLARLRSMTGKPFTASSEDHRHRWRLLITELPDSQFVTIGEDLANVDSAVDRLIFVNVLVGLAVLMALAAVGVWVVRISLRPLVEMERTAAAIAGGDLAQRVPDLDPHTELGQLSTSLNTMLTQIEAAFLARAASEAKAVSSEERMRQFVADASHELRTPLTTIRGFAELYRQGAAPDPADVLRRIEDEAARMGLLVEDLLLLARLDQERPLHVSPVALADLVTDAAAAARAVAPDRDISVDIDEPVGPLVVAGDEPRLRQVVGNLVTNALTHTPAGTPVTLRLYSNGARPDGSADGSPRAEGFRPDGPRPDSDGYAVVEVSDRGQGLTPEQAQRVFERFYRVDKARTRRVEPASASGFAGATELAARHSGAGLGLAIVAALVAAHRGTVEVESTHGAGATFRVRLPLAAPDWSGSSPLSELPVLGLL